LTHTTSQTDSQVQLWIAHGTGQTAKNKATFKALEAQKVAIEADFGAPLDWQELPAGEGCRIRYVVDGAGPVSWRLSATAPARGRDQAPAVRVVNSVEHAKLDRLRLNK
jgi:hypothetical protein